MLHAGIALAGRHRLVYRVARHLGTEMRAVAGPEALHRRLVEQRLADRPEHHAVECAGGALGHRVEPPDRFQFVAAEVAAARLLHAGRDHVDAAAAYGLLARLAAGCGAAVAAPRQPHPPTSAPPI